MAQAGHCMSVEVAKGEKLPEICSRDMFQEKKTA
jgi:hypothetical protein